MIWGIFVLLTLVAIGIVLYPLLLSKSNTLTRGDAVPAILADQMREIQRDMDRGLISEQEAQAARLEIKKRILATTRNSEEKAGSSRNGGRVTLVVAAVLALCMLSAGTSRLPRHSRNSICRSGCHVREAPKKVIRFIGQHGTFSGCAFLKTTGRLQAWDHSMPPAQSEYAIDGTKNKVAASSRAARPNASSASASFAPSVADAANT